MDPKQQSQIDTQILAFLKKRGYTSAAATFQNEAKLQNIDEHVLDAMLSAEMSIENSIGHSVAADNSLQRYTDSYQQLTNWIHQSLDIYRVSVRLTSAGTSCGAISPFCTCFPGLDSPRVSRSRFCSSDPTARAFFEKFKDEHKEAHFGDIQALTAVPSLQQVVCSFRLF